MGGLGTYPSMRKPPLGAGASGRGGTGQLVERHLAAWLVDRRRVVRRRCRRWSYGRGRAPSLTATAPVRTEFSGICRPLAAEARRVEPIAVDRLRV